MLSFSQGVHAIALPRAPCGAAAIVATSSAGGLGMPAGDRRVLTEKEQQVVNFFAGGLAAPIEIVKTQLQATVMSRASAVDVVRKVYELDGLKGFFKGVRPLLVGIIPTRAIYFWSYSATKENLKTTPLGDGPLNHLASAFAAGITSNTLTNPLWMVKTRFQLMADTSRGQVAFKNYRQVIDAILKEEGPRGFFKGLSASYFGCVEGAIQWMMYEKAKTMIIGHKADKGEGGGNNAMEYFVAAAVSKAAAVLLTYPHEVVRTRLREQAQGGAFKYQGFFQSLQLIAKEEGRRGLYGGMGLHLLRSVPNAAIMFVSFELMQSYIAQMYSAVPVDTVAPR